VKRGGRREAVGKKGTVNTNANAARRISNANAARHGARALPAGVLKYLL